MGFIFHFDLKMIYSIALLKCIHVKKIVIQEFSLSLITNLVNILITMYLWFYAGR